MEELCYPWDQKSLGIAGPIDDVPLAHLQLRFIAVVNVQPALVTAHAKLLTHMLGLLNHALGAHPPNRHSETPSSLLRVIKLWYIVPALLHSQHRHVKRRERFAYVERGDITLLPPWLMECASRASTRHRGPTYEATDAAKCERASSACRHSGWVSVAAPGLLTEPRAHGDEVTWERIKAKFPGRRPCVRFRVDSGSGGSKLHGTGGRGCVPNWRPEEEFDSQVALDVINSRNASSGAGK